MKKTILHSLSLLCIVNKKKILDLYKKICIILRERKISLKEAFINEI